MSDTPANNPADPEYEDFKQVLACARDMARDFETMASNRRMTNAQLTILNEELSQMSRRSPGVPSRFENRAGDPNAAALQALKQSLESRKAALKEMWDAANNFAQKLIQWGEALEKRRSRQVQPDTRNQIANQGFYPTSPATDRAPGFVPTGWIGVYVPDNSGSAETEVSEEVAAGVPSSTSQMPVLPAESVGSTRPSNPTVSSLEAILPQVQAAMAEWLRDASFQSEIPSGGNLAVPLQVKTWAKYLSAKGIDTSSPVGQVLMKRIEQWATQVDKQQEAASRAFTAYQNSPTVKIEQIADASWRATAVATGLNTLSKALVSYDLANGTFDENNQQSGAFELALWLMPFLGLEGGAPESKLIPWSSRSVAKAAKDLKAGAPQCDCGYSERGRGTLLGQLPRLWIQKHHRNVAYASQRYIRIKKNSTYHWDIISGHGPMNPHGKLPHLQIHDDTGEVI